MNIHLLPEIHGLRRAEYEQQYTTYERCLGVQDLIQTMQSNRCGTISPGTRELKPSRENVNITPGSPRHTKCSSIKMVCAGTERDRGGQRRVKRADGSRHKGGRKREKGGREGGKERRHTAREREIHRQQRGMHAMHA